MPPFTLGAKGAYIVIQIGGKPWTLKTGDISSSGTFPHSVKYQFKDYEKPIDVGTFDQLIEALQESFNIVKGPESFADQWELLQGELARAPMIGDAIATIKTTDVQIVEAAVEFNHEEQEPSKLSGTVQLGITFIPQKCPQFLNITIRRVGTILTFGFTGVLSQVSDATAQ